MKFYMTKAKLLFLLLLMTIAFVGCDDDDASSPSVVAGFTFVQNAETGTVTFTNTSQNADSFSWDFGNGETSTETSPVTTFEDGTFTVTLQASNIAGASDVFVDEIIVQITGTGSNFDSGLLVNGDFETGSIEPWIGNAANVEFENNNNFNSANVEVAGNPFDVNLSQVVAITEGTNYILTFDAASDRERTLLAGIGLNEAPFTNTSALVNLVGTTQNYSLQLTAADFGGANSRVLFDMGADVGLVLIDNVSLVEGGDGSDSGNVGGPFDSGLLVNGDFETGSSEPWIGNAANVEFANNNNFNSANVTVAGNAFDVNLSQVVEITQGTNYILTFDAASDQERTMLAGIGLNEAPFTNTTVEIDLIATTQNYSLQLTAADFGGANSRVLFDMGADVGLVLIDNVSLVEGGDGSDSNGGGGNFDSGLLVNGDFEAGIDPWFGNAANIMTDGGNSFNFANVATAGNPFDVNLSQVVEITQGTSYILTFDASSDQERTLVAGIGLNENPFTAAIETVNLTPDLQTFTLMLDASDFGGANSRVLFDMGADVGVVVIDNVSLVEQ